MGLSGAAGLRRPSRYFFIPPLLAIPNFNLPFILQSDAIAADGRVVLLQELPERCRPIAFASRTLTVKERKFSVYELDALAVLYGAERFGLYVEHFNFIVECGNKLLLIRVS